MDGPSSSKSSCDFVLLFQGPTLINVHVERDSTHQETLLSSRRQKCRFITSKNNSAEATRTAIPRSCWYVMTWKITEYAGPPSEETLNKVLGDIFFSSFWMMVPSIVTACALVNRSDSVYDQRTTYIGKRTNKCAEYRRSCLVRWGENKALGNSSV